MAEPNILAHSRRPNGSVFLDSRIRDGECDTLKNSRLEKILPSVFSELDEILFSIFAIKKIIRVRNSAEASAIAFLDRARFAPPTTAAKFDRNIHDIHVRRGGVVVKQ